MRKPLRTLLVANRGEIARRILASARKLGWKTIAIHAPDDADLPHVREADIACPLVGSRPSETYLDSRQILEIAQREKVDAIHPGYGFLAENAEFARACAAADIVFVGPSAQAIELMGSKSDAKACVVKAGVPVVPGYHGDDQDPVRLNDEARRIGYPVLLKASAGGGGKGMRAVFHDSEFSEALGAAKREAIAGFGDDRMLIEKLIQKPRHVEVQLLFDAHGRGLALFDRDCSLQRRHQKVVEEAPAPGLRDETRRQLYAMAIACGEAIGYCGAGTIEFLLDADQSFYFMEMNTRLQVEHPVTELITGWDLVEWQLRIACGEALPELPPQKPGGHAIEVRLCAEDPDNDFLPATGTLESFELPSEAIAFSLPARDQLVGLRADVGFERTNAVSSAYDSMLGKLIAWGPDRESARSRLLKGLSNTRIGGCASNRDYLIRALNHPAFAKADLSTHFLEQHQPDLLPPEALPSPVKTTAAWLLYAHQPETTPEPQSPWETLPHWRLFGGTRLVCPLLVGQTLYEPELLHSPDGWRIHCGDGDEAFHMDVRDGRAYLTLDNRRSILAWQLTSDDQLWIWDDHSTWVFRRPTYGSAHGNGDDGQGLQAPMGGTVVRIDVQAGQRVVRGEILLIMEAMKMETAIRAPIDGEVLQLLCYPGEVVLPGQNLISMEAVSEDV